ncbi:MAG TPA: hypothetical protein VMI54_19725 [Polyangiaceae bacterium]|nr:hypothetical protein [Polyangiaceae bacterium]
MIAKITGYEFSIVAILVGVVVGAAVRHGAGGSGGRRYQELAVFLTYSAIALANIPPILAEIAARAPPAPALQPTFTGIVQSWLLIVGLAYALPFLSGTGGLMRLGMIGIGLLNAWNQTAARRPTVLGPIPLP